MSSLVDEQKLANYQAAASHFGGWLEDQLVFGLSAIEADPYNHLEDIASRLTDLQLPGPASALRDWIARVGVEEDWTEQLLRDLGYWHLQCALLQNLKNLTDEQLSGVLINFGLRIRQADLLSSEPENLDTWTCIGIEEGENKNVYYRRTYWQGTKSEHHAVQLVFNYGSPVQATLTTVGTSGEFGVHSYPGGMPSRVLLPQKINLKNREVDPFVHADWGAQQAFQRSLIAEQPWRREMPLSVKLKQLIPSNSALQLVDHHGVALVLPMLESDTAAWTLWSIAADLPCKLYGIIRSERVELLSVLVGGELFRLME